MERRLHSTEWLLVALVLAAILTIVFWPTPVDRPFDGGLRSALADLHRNGVPGWLDYRFVETAANVVMFVPLGALIASVSMRTLWWTSGVLGLALSLCIEFTQYTLLPARTASASDLLANTAGALVGGAAVALLRARRSRPAAPHDDAPTPTP